MDFLYLLEDLRAPWLDAIVGALTHLGGEMVFLIAALVVFWCVDKRQGYYLLSVGFLGTLVNQFLKIACRIPGPGSGTPASPSSNPPGRRPPDIPSPQATPPAPWAPSASSPPRASGSGCG